MPDSVQAALSRCTRTWTAVNEHLENPSGYGVDCPSCDAPCDVGVFPIDASNNEIAGIHGFGCVVCQNVVPSGVGMSQVFGGGDGYSIAEIELQSGDVVEALVVTQ